MDVAPTAGLRYRWVMPGPRPINILQGLGGGCAFLDYDNSGNLSVLLVGTDRVALFKGDGHGHFTDVIHRMGLDKLRGHFLGVAVGDYDNDGYDDLYISGYRTGVLLHNERGVRFRDVTKPAGLKPQPWGTSCAWADIDHSGRLSLYVANYVYFDPKAGPQLCSYHSFLSACGPRSYRPARGVLYRNLGNGKFQDATTTWGARNTTGSALGVAFADFNRSGRASLAVADDQVPNDLLQNTGRGFRNVSRAAGVAFGSGGSPMGNMGIDWGDYDNDGQLDLIIATFENQLKSVYHNDGGYFSDRSATIGMREAVPNVTFGVKWIDYDNDGWLDVLVSNGHVQDNVAAVNAVYEGLFSTAYRQPVQLFRNVRGAHFVDASTMLARDARRPIVGRGLAIGDYDNDGRMDALVVDSEGRPLLLQNQTRAAGHWLGVRLVGTRSNCDGYGAMLMAAFAGRKLLRHCHADGSYLASSDKRVHFGLGSATVVDALTIRWPSGRIQILHHVPADHYIIVREPR